jgi:hypothetical protein
MATNQYNPSPYMAPSSAGNPASSYGSQGGAQAGAWGQPAPQQGGSFWSPNQQGGGYTYTGPGSTSAAQHPSQPSFAGGGAQSQSGSWGWPQQQQQPYQYQPSQQQSPQQAPPRPQGQPTAWQYPQAPQQGGDPYQQWMSQIMQPYNPQNAPPPPPQQAGSPQQMVVNAYQQYLGRTPSANEINDYLRSGSAQAAVANIARSSEAQQYQQRGPQQPQGGYQPQGGAPQPGRAYVPPQGVNTDGYPQPRLTQMPQANAMPGWDNSKWRDPNHQTPKYVVGRLLQDIPPRTENMAMAMQRIQAAYPGARQIGPGDVSIPGVGSVDILQSAGAGGKAWQWGGGDSGSKFDQSTKGYDVQTAQGGGDLSSLIAMLMGGPQQNVMTAQSQAVDPAAAAAAAKQKAADALAAQRAATAAAEAKQAQGPGGVHPSFAYY